MVNRIFYKKTEDIINQFKNNITQSDLKNQIIKHFKNEPTEIVNRIINEFFFYGPLHTLMDKNEITEIFVNGPKDIYYESHGKIKKHDDSFHSETTFINFIHLINAQTRTKIDLSKPHLNISWNGFRVHIISKPISQKTTLTLRRSSHRQWNFNNLIENKWADQHEIQIISTMIKNKKNILIVGTTGSGKTTLINCLLQNLSENERCIIIEDTDELICPSPLSIKLLTRIEPRLDLESYYQEDLIKQCLRMRPDRIILGEVRGREAKDYLLALSTGHNGGFCSLHADGAKQALIRLEMLVQLGAPNWSIKSIQQLIKLSIDYIISVDQIKGRRHLKSIDKISSLETTGFTYENIYQRKNYSA